MTMQLFSFGHPCEHQLRRTCIGGSSCPLNGYPDMWCCSYIKGKINFKRDKPCEGPRCRWGFTHPTQAQFDSVTQVLGESRPIAAKIDEADDKEVLSFHIENTHIVDTVQCTLHMMRHPPSTCARRVGQLLAFAAVKAGDAKVFMQLLKTMKKPVDSYILGAYVYLTQATPPTPSPAVIAMSAAAAAANASAKVKKGAAAVAISTKDRKEAVLEDLKNDMVDLMKAALSQGGHLIDREDQHLLQATFIAALRHYPKGNKKRQEMLEAALSKFNSRQLPKETPRAASVGAATTSTNTITPPTSATSGVATAAAGNASTTSVPAAPVTATAAEDAGPTSVSTATLKAHTTSSNSSSKAVEVPSPPPATASATESIHTWPSPAQTDHTNHKTVSLATPATSLTPKHAAVASPAKLTPQTPVQQPPPQPIVGISRAILGSPSVRNVFPRPYDPIRTDLPLPDVLLFGGQMTLAADSALRCHLGPATRSAPLVNRRSSILNLAGCSNKMPVPGVPKADGSMSAYAAAAATGAPPAASLAATNATVGAGGNTLFVDSIFGNLSTDPVFGNLDDAVHLFKDLDMTWGS